MIVGLELIGVISLVMMEASVRYPILGYSLGSEALNLLVVCDYQLSVSHLG